MPNDMFSFDYNSYADIESIMSEEVLILIGAILMVFLLFAAIWGIISWVFTSIGMYTIAQRREIRHPWMAWVPYLNAWILGSISDQYRYVVKGKITRRRVALLVTVALSFAVSFLSGFTDAVLGFAEETQSMSILITLVFALVSLVVSLVHAVFYYMALYDLYKSSDPRHDALYLVLSILLGVVTPFLIFACRNKEGGMPVRKADYEARMRQNQPPMEPLPPTRPEEPDTQM